jgi:hypothetical protein
MKQMMFSKVLRVVACVPALCASVPTFGVADQAQYIYDDLGRMWQMIDGQGTFSPTTTVEARRGGASQQGLRHNGVTLGKPL